VPAERLRPVALHRRIAVFFAGVQKGGTTTLHEYLRGHPAMSPPHVKELHHFDDEARNWANGADLARLEAAFTGGDAGRLRYDATPIHGFWPPALLRIRAYNPAARLVWIFRDPVARAFSHWRMERARGEETLSFAQAIREGRARIAHEPPLARPLRVHSYVERGFYGQQVANGLALFPRAQHLFLTSEELDANPDATLARLAAFLDIAPFAPGQGLRAHVGVPMPEEAPSPADRALLLGLWRQDLARFSALTGLCSARWLAPG